MSTRELTVLLALVMVALSACNSDTTSTALPGSQQAAPSDSPLAVPADSIPWFQGDVELAFAAARDQGKPVFLYFGAEWCPYCKELQATIFTRDRFVELSRQFIPIDLGGDSEGNIRYGDRFNVYGLPTVIVFSPDGEEITRIAGGLNMEQYADVLELTLNSIRPVSELILAVQQGNTISDDDWHLLAAYSWGQDKGQALGEQSAHTVLRELAAACPARLARAGSRLRMAALEEWLADEGRDVSLAADYLLQVNAMLADKVLFQENLLAFANSGADMVTTLAGKDQQLVLQKSLLQHFALALEDPSLDLLVRGYVLAGWAETATALLADDEQLSSGQIAWLKAEADETMAELGPYQQHAGLNTLWQVYYTVGLQEDARAALMTGIEVSRAPYYFMSSLAYLERKSGNNAAALNWYRKAWASSTGPTTRTRWGMNYVVRLVDMAPTETDQIREASNLLIAEVSAQRNWQENYQRRFARLSNALLDWSGSASGADAADRREVISGLKQQMTQLCTDVVAGTAASATCSSFLAEQSAQRSS